MKEIGIGLIGTGFMGKAHAIAYRNALAVFPDIPVPRLVALADVNADAASKAAHQYRFESSTGNWKDLIANPAVQVVSITTPNSMHKEMALAAIAGWSRQASWARSRVSVGSMPKTTCMIRRDPGPGASTLRVARASLPTSVPTSSAWRASCSAALPR